MDRDPERLNEMREAYARLNDETLLEQLIEEGDEFEPEARELMEAELKSRGYSDADLAQHRRAAAGREPGHGAEDNLVPLATFDQPGLANQVREELRQHGIEAVLAGQDGLYPMSGGLSAGTTGATLLVLSGDLAAAEAVLEGFGGAAEEVEEDSEKSQGG